IANTPRQTLIRALGEATGSSLYELAWGRDYRDVVIDEPEKSISAAETFAYDLENEEEILREYLRLCEKATSRMRSRNLRAKTVSIKVRFADFKTISRSKTFPLAINGTQETFAVVKQLYEALDIAGARLRLVGVGLENLVENEGAAHQPALGEREIGWAQAEAAVDRAIARFGSGSIKPARLVENESTSTSEQDSD
ncbi:MAG: DNA polymerase IV, partial [Acidobacteria bacterium]|nr:DNA polymerase IV [Acidobacteriota bacterium]